MKTEYYSLEPSFKELYDCYHISALIVKKYGDAYLPIFEKFNKEIEDRKRKEKLRELALRTVNDNVDFGIYNGIHEKE